MLATQDNKVSANIRRSTEAHTLEAIISRVSNLWH